jgi:hypothetical protein
MIAPVAVTTSHMRPNHLAAGPLLGPWWRRMRLWFGLAVLVVLAAAVVTALSTPPGRPLDPTSSSKDGSQALARLLTDHGTKVHRTMTLTGIDPGQTVVVPFPDSYSSEQLTDLAGSGHRLVLAEPLEETLQSVNRRLSVAPAQPTQEPVAPQCDLPGPNLAGKVAFPLATESFSGLTTCYGGRIVLTDKLVVLGSTRLLRNDGLAATNVAALVINSISDDGRTDAVTWLMPGLDAQGSGTPSPWDLFPDWIRVAFWWLVIVGLLTALWKGRRMGPVVTEPLPVVVRAAEIVEGQGRLYQRAQARDRAAVALRNAALRRLAKRYGLPRGASVGEVVTSTISKSPGSSTRSDTTSVDVGALLSGPPPDSDASLVRLAVALSELEAKAAPSIRTPLSGPDPTRKGIPSG